MEPVHDIFISHLRRDEQPARGLARRLKEWGFDVHADFHDPALTRPAGREAADRLKEGMGSCRIILFAFSSESANSKWMPWQLGLAHGVTGKVVIWPLDGGVKWTPRTREYLSLYDVVDPANAKDVMEELVSRARELSAERAPGDPAASTEDAATAASPGSTQPDAFMEFAVNRPAQLYMAWINALMGMGKR